MLKLYSYGKNKVPFFEDYTASNDVCTKGFMRMFCYLTGSKYMILFLKFPQNSFIYLQFCMCFVEQWIFFFLFITDDKEQKQSQKVLGELENIDDDCDRNDIAFVKIDDDKEAAEWGIDEIPTIVRAKIWDFRMSNI